MRQEIAQLGYHEVCCRGGVYGFWLSLHLSPRSLQGESSDCDWWGQRYWEVYSTRIGLTWCETGFDRSSWREIGGCARRNQGSWRRSRGMGLRYPRGKPSQRYDSSCTYAILPH